MDTTSSNYTYDPLYRLTQTLSDGATAYVYGAGRLAQIDGSAEYFLGDALGSVRQLVDSAGAVSLAQSFDPYGQTQSQAGDGASSYAFTGEYSANGLVYLRARHYAPSMGRFLSRDTWAGDANRPQSLNRWAYVEGNPVRFTDPSGLVLCEDVGECENTGQYPYELRDVDLTLPTYEHFGGSQLKALYDKMAQCRHCWWYRKGYFTFEMFVGSLIYHEGVGTPIKMGLVGRAMAQQLFVGGWKPAYCNSRGLCRNGVYNYWVAYSESANSLIKKYVIGQTNIETYFGYRFDGKKDPLNYLNIVERYGKLYLYKSTLNYDSSNALSEYGNNAEYLDQLNRRIKNKEIMVIPGVLYPYGNHGIYYISGLSTNVEKGIDVIYLSYNACNWLLGKRGIPTIYSGVNSSQRAGVLYE